MPGHYVSRVWTYNPTLDAPAKYRRACKYDAFIPLRLTGLSLKIEATVAGVVSEAEAAIRDLNAGARPALAPLARLLLRTESMASSKIEGVQTGVRELARAEAKVEAGGKASATALEVLANIDAMQLAMDEASAVDRFARARSSQSTAASWNGTSTPSALWDRSGRARTGSAATTTTPV